jgi:hypothetical protein
LLEITTGAGMSMKTKRIVLWLVHGGVLCFLLLWGDRLFGMQYRSLKTWAAGARHTPVATLKGPGMRVDVQAASNGTSVVSRTIDLDKHAKLTVHLREKREQTRLQEYTEHLIEWELWDWAQRLGVVCTALLACALVWACDPPRRRQLLWLIVAFMVTGSGVWFVQHMLGRLRPSDTVLVPEYVRFPAAWMFNTRLCFPSGHTTFAFTLAAFLGFHYPKARWVFYLAAGLTGASRVIQGAHWPGDVYAGALWAVVATRFICRRGRQPDGTEGTAKG